MGPGSHWIGAYAYHSPRSCCECILPTGGKEASGTKRFYRPSARPAIGQHSYQKWASSPMWTEMNSRTLMDRNFDSVVAYSENQSRSERGGGLPGTLCLKSCGIYRTIFAKCRGRSIFYR